MFKTVLIICVLFFCIQINAQKNISFNKYSDSLQELLKLSDRTNFDLTKRLHYALKAVQLSKRINQDSISLKVNMNLSNVYLDMDSYEDFGKINHINLKLSQKLSDTISQASINNNLGWYYLNKLESDSTYFFYFRASKLYSRIGDKINKALVLFNMANLQDDEKDYLGGENNAFNAIKLIEDLPKTQRNLDLLWTLYNLVGLMNFKLGSFQKAIEYHNKALKYSSKINDNYYHTLSTKINLSLTYEAKGDYDKSIELNEEVLKDKNLYDNDLDTYIKVLNNLAYTRLIYKGENTREILSLLRKSYLLNESIEESEINKIGISNSLSEYFLSVNKKDSAFYYNKQALSLARKLKSNDHILRSLLLMSRVKGGDEGLRYLNEYRVLNDSLLQRERNYRNKFARIEYETDQLEADNAILSKERLLFLFLSIGLMLSLTLLYIVITQRSRNKELRFKQEQQEANEEIYNLMLAQQDKIEEGRTKEKKRISQELHDGVLGRLFGTRLSLDSLNMINTNEAIENREQYINELKTIEQDIRKISHDLNTDFIGGSNFVDIIKNLVETQTEAYGLDYNFVDDETINWDDFSNKNKIHIYRMLQECMQNIYKHAKAKSINIGFTSKNNVTLVSIEDDGVGFNINKAKKGIGIKNIYSRVKELGGKVDINSLIGKGTNIVISIPINQ